MNITVIGDCRETMFLQTIDELCEAAVHNPRHIAESLSRLWRFGGQHPTANVLNHSLEVAWMCRHLSPAAQLWALFHDAHEILTGEIPRQHKSIEILNIQGFYDMRLKTALGVALSSSEEKEIERQDTLSGDMERKHWAGYIWQWRQEQYRLEIAVEYFLHDYNGLMFSVNGV